MSHSTQPIAVAIAGLGFGEAVHLPALQANSALRAAALWHPSPDRLQQATEQHGLPGYNDWNSLLDNPEIEAVIIATPPEPRFGLAQRALNAGKHLLLEKPVALNADQVEQLQRLAIRQQRSVAVNFEYRAVPLFMQAQRLLVDGAVGTPWLVKLDWLMGSRADGKRPWTWYSQSSAGGGVIGALGTHAFDTLAWLIGPVSKVQAMNSVSITQRHHPTAGSLTVDAEDTSLIQAQLQISDSPEHYTPAQITLSSVTRCGRGCWLEVYGSQGSLILGSNNQSDYVHGFGLWHAPAGERLRSVPAAPDLAFSKTWGDGRIAPVARLQSWWAKSMCGGPLMIPGLVEGFESQLACDQALGKDQSLGLIKAKW